jgi:hypothetical protein
MKTRMGYHYKGYDEDQGHVSSFWQSCTFTSPPDIYLQFWLKVGLKVNLAHTPHIDGIYLCILVQTYSIWSFKYTLTVENGFRPRNIIILGEISHRIWIWTRDHHAGLCGEGDFFAPPTQPQLMGGMSAFQGDLRHKWILFWRKCRSNSPILNQKIMFNVLNSKDVRRLGVCGRLITHWKLSCIIRSK